MPGSSRDYIVRSYQERDREWVMKIAADTAFFGDPLEAFLDDRRLFIDIFYRYYLELEPQHAWVTEVGKEVAGFLMGCANTGLQRRRWSTAIFPSFLWKVCRGNYRIRTKTWHYLWRLSVMAIRHEHTQVDEHLYPAHLHVNVSREWRGMGMGRQLMLAFLDQLRQEHIRGVHLVTSSMNQAATGLYESLGFTLLDKRPTNLWKDVLNTPVENLCYGLEFN